MTQPVGNGHTFFNRYAMTNAGPVMIRTLKPKTAKQARRIIEGYVVTYPNGDMTRLKVDYFGGLRITFGWVATIMLLDETQVQTDGVQVQYEGA